MLIKILPYSGATAQTRSAALWGVSGSYGKAPAQQGMSGLIRETSHLWLYSSPSPSLQPILGETATSVLIVLYTFECIMWVATESDCEDTYRATSKLSNFIIIFFRHVTEVMHWNLTTLFSTGEIKTKTLHLYLLIIYCVVYRWRVIN